MATYQGPIKDFYSLQEFYSFIRQDDNTPSGHRHFTLVPFIANPCNKNGITDPVITRLFTTNNLRKFQLCVQKISLPNFTLNSGDIKGTLSNSTPLGVWQTVDNTTIFPDKNTFQITLLDTMDPIIERFIYPWYVECLRTKNSLSSAYPFPRLNFAIKYYREDRVRQNMNGIKPNFVYWIEGVYPSTVEACTIDHKLDTGGGEIFRIITVAQALDVENFADGKARLLEYKLNEKSVLLNQKIRDCAFPEHTIIVGITRDSELFIPTGETIFEQDDKVIFMGLAHQLDKLAGTFFH